MSKQPLKVMMIGAGGVASYLLPVLLRTFTVHDSVLIDKDVLEERNLDRQLFDEEDIGKNKASALLSKNWHNQMGKQICAIDSWFDGSQSAAGYDAILCMADNHRARERALQAADDAQVPCFIGGNEYFESEAWAYLPGWQGDPELDPRVRFPTIVDNDTGNPIRCTGEAQEAFPQLAIANQRCASQLLHLMWIWLVEWPRLQKELTDARLLLQVYQEFPARFLATLRGTETMSVNLPYIA